jgi:hypothetical protein
VLDDVNAGDPAGQEVQVDQEAAQAGSSVNPAVGVGALAPLDNYCRGVVKATGARCGARATSSGFCPPHDPSRQAQMAEARLRGGSTTAAAVSRGTYGVQNLAARLDDAAGVLRVLETTADAVAAGRMSANAGAVIGQLARVAVEVAQARTEAQIAALQLAVDKALAEQERRR